MTAGGTRVGRVERETAESSVLVEIDLDGGAAGGVDIDTGVPFFDHMLAQLGRHGGFALTVRTKGDLEVDAHHTVEDTAIALGEAFRQALGDKSGIRRFGDALVPLDEVLVQAAVDLSGRPYLVHREPDGMPPMIGTLYATTLTRHVWESFAHNARIALHVIVHSGRDAHHIVEAQFKAVARALREATARDPRVGGVPSTKGVL
jgi:imidazoleglycerol-phosphate dehydratase